MTAPDRCDEVVWLDHEHAWYVRSHAAATRVLRDAPGFASNLGDGDVQGPIATRGAAPLSILTHCMMFSDPPEHPRLRGAVSGWFTPRAAKELHHVVDRVVTAALDGLPRGEFDLVQEIAYPVPVTIMASLLDVGAEGATVFLDRTPPLARMLDAQADDDMVNAGLEAATDMSLFLLEKAVERRANPGTDLLSAMAHPESGLALDEVALNALLLLTAGHDTTANAIANSMVALLAHPDQRALIESPDVDMPRALNELLRYDAPVRRIARRTTSPVRLAGHDIERDANVVVGLGEANHDPAVWPDPDRLDLTRDGPPPLSFGNGSHHCVGMALARIELEVVLRELLRRYPTLRVVEEPRRRPTSTFSAWQELWLGP